MGFLLLTVSAGARKVRVLRKICMKQTKKSRKVNSNNNKQLTVSKKEKQPTTTTTKTLCYDNSQRLGLADLFNFVMVTLLRAAKTTTNTTKIKN